MDMHDSINKTHLAHLRSASIGVGHQMGHTCKGKHQLLPLAPVNALQGAVHDAFDGHSFALQCLPYTRCIVLLITLLHKDYAISTGFFTGFFMNLANPWQQTQSLCVLVRICNDCQ